MKTLRVDVWSDVACPWCWVGKRHLERAVEQFGGRIEVTWHSFELDPQAPADVPADVDLVQRLADKYGASRAQAESMIERMTEVGRSVDLDFRFERVRPTSTFDAHRLLHFAHARDKQDALKERLFRAYMHEGKSVADPDVLLAIAIDVGLDEAQARAVIESDAHADDVRQDEALAMQLGVRGVPFFVVAGQYGVSGAQPPEVLLEVLQKAQREGLEDEIEVEAVGPVCGPDGC